MTRTPQRRPGGAIRAAALPCLLLTAAGAQAAPAFVDPPRLLETRPGQPQRNEAPVGGAVRPGMAVPEAGRPAAPRFSAPAPAGQGGEGRRYFDLTVRMVDGSIDNPREGRPDRVRLRGYTGEGVDPKAPYVAPQIEVKPGQRVTIALHNDLDDDPSCLSHGDMDKPHCFNGTNLHAHGLWVSPAGNSDNVLLSINPKTGFTYGYDLPDEHPSGTFWYHSHRHGSTALQVSSGMAGALIVRGDRLPTMATPGDLDVLLKGAGGNPVTEHTVVFQQIQYACYTKVKDKGGKEIEVVKRDGPNGPYICDPTDVGVIKDESQFGPNQWAQSGRYTTINGLVQPEFKARAGDVERWRMIHGGVRDTITVAFRPLVPGAAPLAADADAAAAESWIKQNCGAPIRYHAVASDGLTMPSAQEVKTVTFQPGYRWDALVIFPRAGRYCVTNETAPKAGSVSQQDKGVGLLATVEVEGGQETPDTGAALTKALVEAADRTTMQDDVKRAVEADLRDGLKLARFVPHRTIESEDVTGHQEMTFLLQVPEQGKTGPVLFQIADQAIVLDPAGQRRVNPDFKPASYDPAVIDRVRPLNGVDEWTLQTAGVNHPFHIHVNPFQIVEILDPSGRDVSAIGAKDGDDPQYAGLKGLWKDTIWIKSTPPSDTSPPYPDKDTMLKSVYTIKVRTRYERFIGQFVLHCHILDHEDQGMMQNVCIDLPGSVGVCGGQTRRAADMGAMHMQD